eukprot:6175472-Pleurochrysis_carterae.AAC.5
MDARLLRKSSTHLTTGLNGVKHSPQLAAFGPTSPFELALGLASPAASMPMERSYSARRSGSERTS